MNKKYFYKYAISKQQQIQKESNHLFQVALLFFFLKNLIRLPGSSLQHDEENK